MARSQEPTRTGQWRFHLVFVGMILMVMGLGVRLWYLTQSRAALAHQINQRQQQRTIPLPARVGSIYGRMQNRYVPMAVSYQVPTCFADPALMTDSEILEISDKLGSILKVDPMDIQSRIVLRRDKRYVRLLDYSQREISKAQVEAVQKLGNRSIGIENFWKREYPCQSLASTVVGFRRLDGKAGGGLELSLDVCLSAMDGKQRVQVDAAGRAIQPFWKESYHPRDGNSVYLSLDPEIQRFLQDAVNEAVETHGGEKTWGTGIVVDPFTGEILAMCSAPGYNPNNYNREGSSLTNRAITMPFEPGSIVKPLFAAAAINEGVATYQTKIYCEKGRYRAHRGGTITDHGKSYEWETVEEGIVKSINTLMSKLGERLGNKRLHEIAYRFGFGTESGICLPGESRGIVRPLRKWDGYSLRRVPFGQEISTTAIQMVMAFSSLANGGELLMPQLVDQIRSPENKLIYKWKRRVVRRVLRRSVANQSLAVLQKVVERGTGTSCKMDRWTSFGKTGTAQIPGPGGYIDGAYTGSFVGGAPASRPRLVCLISIYWPDKAKGYYGGTVAAPYVKKVLERSLTYLKVAPDRASQSDVAVGLP